MSGTSILIRPIQPDDYDAAARLFVTAYPNRSREIPHWEASRRLEGARRWVAIDPRTLLVAGYGAIWRVQRDKFRMDLVIDPSWRRRGTGARLLGELIATARLDGARTLQARAEADDSPSLAFLGQRGFVETMRMHRLVLAVAGVDLTPLAGLEARLASVGIQITTFQEEQKSDPAVWEKLRDMYNAARNGWPDPDPDPGSCPEPEPLSVAAVRELFSSFDPGNKELFIARCADIYAGFTGGVGTGVRPHFRNRGIATALKVCAIARARDLGTRTLHSSSGNPAMLRVNEKLGYRRSSTEVRLVRKL